MEMEMRHDKCTLKYVSQNSSRLRASRAIAHPCERKKWFTVEWTHDLQWDWKRIEWISRDDI